MTTSRLALTFESVISEISRLSPDDYYQFVFQHDFNHYLNRVEMAGFTGRQRVLDIGCGYGQWAMALAQHNSEVIGIDRNEKMLESARIMQQKFGVSNVTFELGQMPHLEFANESFDFIWCWGLLMFLEREASLRLFHRILKKGGRVLFGGVNGRGRWIYKLLKAAHPFCGSRPTFKMCFEALFKNKEGANHYTTLAQCSDICDRFGFKLIACNYDGCIDLSGQNRKLPMFSPKFFGLENNIEFIAEKLTDP